MNRRVILQVSQSPRKPDWSCREHNTVPGDDTGHPFFSLGREHDIQKYLRNAASVVSLPPEC
jgi:hypothetical protein